MKDDKYLQIREKSVVKANELIQKSRFSLSAQQQKIVLYLISQIEPQDEDFKLYEFDIREFCAVCGIGADSGRNYEMVKSQIQKIRDKSIWITLSDGRETTLSWIEKPYIDKRKGKIQIRLDNDMKPFLLQLKNNFTKYELIYTLRFRSKYTIRLYELIKSIHFQELEAYVKQYDLDNLRSLLDAETYKTFQAFKVRVLEPAIREINTYSDKSVSYKKITRGKSVIGIEFEISSKDAISRLELIRKINEELGIDEDQITFWDI